MAILRFAPIYQERIWGGQGLNRHLRRAIPADLRIGESWDVVDRPETCNGVVGTTLTLHDLWTSSRIEYFGSRAPNSPRFPILIKVLDCVEVLSLQVHPPAGAATDPAVEPKTELWYFLQTEPGARIYAGLKAGVRRRDFARAIGTPDLAALLHSLPTQPGQSMFLPSGRVHAIGAGNLILEIQQNSDTTYRVDDWGRIEPRTGRPRELHVDQAMNSINFDDEEPAFVQPHGNRILECRYFALHQHYLYPNESTDFAPRGETFHYHFVHEGEVLQDGVVHRPGDGWMVTADHGPYQLTASETAALLVTVSFPRFQ